MRRKRKILAVALIIMLSFNAFSQNVGINIDGTNPDNSAMLDVKSANKGLLIPQIALTGVNDVTTIPTPATSLLVYNTATASGITPGYYYNSGTTIAPVWTRFATGSLSGSGTATQLAFWNSATDLSSSANLFWDNTNSRLGIGTILPAAKLDIYVAGGNSGTNSALLLEAGNTNSYYGNNQILFGFNSSAISYAHAIKSRHNAGGQMGNAIDFYVWNQGIDAVGTVGTKQVMTLDGNGNIGLGTTVPAFQIEGVKNGADVSFVVHSNGFAKGGIAAFASGNRSIAMFSTSVNDDLNFGYSGITESTLGANFVSRMFIDNGTGSVGIGTIATTLL